MLRTYTLLACLASAGSALAGPFEYLAQSLDRITQMASVVNLADYDYRASGSLYGYFLDPGADNGLITEFQAGREYLILAAGDEDVIDLDLVITDVHNRKRVHGADVLGDATPVVSFVPPRTGRFEIRLYNHVAVRPGFCSFVILEKTGQGSFSLNEITEALTHVLVLSREFTDLYYSDLPRNNLILFGGRLSEGETQTTFDITLPTGLHTALASGSGRIHDVDVEVRQQYRANSKDGFIVGEDKDDMPIAVAPFPTRGGNYSITIKNYESLGSGFVFAVLLRNP